MNIKRHPNTKKHGVMEFFIYPEKDRYVGVCLTFDIVEEDKNPIKLMEELKEAAFLHLKVVKTKNLSDDLLNRYAPEEYWEKYFDHLKTLQQRHLEERHTGDQFTTELPYSPESLGDFDPIPA